MWIRDTIKMTSDGKAGKCVRVLLLCIFSAPVLISISGCNLLIADGDKSFFSSEARKQKKKKELAAIRKREEADKEAAERELRRELEKLHDIKPMRYTIGAGDKFDLFVYDNPDLNMQNVIVKPDGTMTVGLIGEVKVAGKTVAEATELIQKKLKRYIKFPKVTLNAYEIQADRFTIVGQVGNPGVYSFDRPILLSDAIAMAKGFPTGEFHGKTIDLASLEHSYISRNNKILPVDFIKAIRKGDPLHNIPIQDNDYIYIASVVNQEIFLLGEVRSPVYLGYFDGLTLARALAYAKGRLETASNIILVIRGSLGKPEIFEVDVEAILAGKVADFPLKLNDLIYVQSSSAEKWNQIIRKITPTLDLIHQALGIKESIFPIRGQFIPTDGWMGKKEGDGNPTLNVNSW